MRARTQPKNGLAHPLKGKGEGTGVKSHPRPSSAEEGRRLKQDSPLTSGERWGPGEREMRGRETFC